MKQEMAMFILILLVISFSNASETEYLLRRIQGIENFKCGDTTGIPHPIRINSNGVIECLSLNGVDCLKVSLNGKKCRNSIHKYQSKNKPVSCPKKLLSIKDKNNWCRKAYDFFFKKWHCPKDTGIKPIVRLNPRTFNVECLSKNGKDCLFGGHKWINSICKKANSSKKFQAKILEMDVGSITGKPRKNIYGGHIKLNFQRVRDILFKNKGKGKIKSNSLKRLKYGRKKKLSLLELSTAAKAKNEKKKKLQKFQKLKKKDFVSLK